MSAKVEERDDRAVAVLVVDGSPTGGGRTRAVLDAIADAARDSGGNVETVALAEQNGAEQALERLDRADAFVLGSPVYRASAAAPLKQLLDRIPRGNDSEHGSPLAAKAVAIVHTGASLHHFLALDSLRDVLAGFFAAHVLPPGLYVPRDGFGDAGSLADPYAEQATRQGAALVELARLLAASSSLRLLRPQA